MDAFKERPAPTDFATLSHKALRAQMLDALVRVGRLDLDEFADRQATLSHVVDLVHALREHQVADEEADAGVPGDQRAAQRVALTAVRLDVRALRHAGGRAELERLSLRLYRRLGLLVAQQMRQMELEDQAAARADHTLVLREAQRVGRLPAGELRETLRWMARALAPAELAALVLRLRGHLCGPRYEHALETLRSELNAARWCRLAREIGQPA